MNEDKGLSPLGAEMVAGMSEFLDAIEAGEPVGKRFTVRTVSLDLETRPYRPEDVRVLRHKLNASQALLAKFLGVSVKTLRSWEQGQRPVPPIACRYMNDILAYPEIWEHRIRDATKEKTGTSADG